MIEPYLASTGSEFSPQQRCGGGGEVGTGHRQWTIAINILVENKTAANGLVCGRL